MRRDWLSLQISIVVAVATAALLPLAMENAPTRMILMRAALFGGFCFCAVSLLRCILTPGHRRAASIAFRVAFLGIFIGGIWLMGWHSKPVPQRPIVSVDPKQTVQDAVHQLAEKLTGKHWAMAGESCDAGDIQFAVDGDYLIAYPRGLSSRNYQLFGVHGQQLILRSGNSPVFLELRDDGFTWIEGDIQQWFGICR